jgi:hypothetical protein
MIQTSIMAREKTRITKFNKLLMGMRHLLHRNKNTNSYSSWKLTKQHPQVKRKNKKVQT